MTPQKFYDEMKDYYCIVENQKQANELHRLCKEVCPDIVEGDLSTKMDTYKYFLLMDDPVQTFVNDSNTYCTAGVNTTAIKKRSFHEMVAKIKSLNMKTEKCHKVNNKCELAAAKAYLEEYFKQKGLEFDIGSINSYFIGGHLFYYHLIKGTFYTIAGVHEQGDRINVSLEEFAQYLVKSASNNKKYDIGNGLTAELKNNTICIGCREYDKEFVITTCLNILNINVDKLVIGCYSFSNRQIEKLYDWLIGLK